VDKTSDQKVCSDELFSALKNTVVNCMTQHKKSILKGITTNKAEGFFSLQSTMTGRKKVFLGLRGRQVYAYVTQIEIAIRIVKWTICIFVMLYHA
jgi:hypothetical protein